MSQNSERSRWRLVAPRILAVVLALVGAALAFGGAQLAMLGGSFYYILTGLACLASAYFLWRGSMRGVWIYALMLLATIVWAFWEVGFSGWELMPRVVGPLVIGLYMALPFNWRPLRNQP